MLYDRRGLKSLTVGGKCTSVHFGPAFRSCYILEATFKRACQHRKALDLTQCMAFSRESALAAQSMHVNHAEKTTIELSQNRQNKAIKRELAMDDSSSGMKWEVGHYCTGRTTQESLNNKFIFTGFKTSHAADRIR